MFFKSYSLPFHAKQQLYYSGYLLFFLYDDWDNLILLVDYFNFLSGGLSSLISFGECYWVSYSVA
jgi:hypothetical protein